MPDVLAYALYLLPIALVYGLYLARASRKQKVNRAVQQENDGLEPPPTLHPVIDHNICIGCEACVHACPEFPRHNVLGVISGKAHLVSPSDCVGHGACQTACPVGAISLVFGTSERGVDIPRVSPVFESSVPGIFIAGELGGMGLIRNAIEQGRQAMLEIVKRHGKNAGREMLDVAIVGAGPAGLSATLVAHEQGLRYVTLEQNSLGGTIAAFPRGKVVMTAPAELAMVGKLNFKETSKESLMEFWKGVEARTGIDVHTRETVARILKERDGFEIVTDRETYRCRAVLLALGRRGTPRKLGVPGENLDKVIYSLDDPGGFAGKRVLVVGGGDSALEAACSLAELENTSVTLSYRSGSFSRAKQKNRQRVDDLEREGRLNVLMNSQVREITPGDVTIESNGSVQTLPNQSVIVCAGGILPTGFLEETGIEVNTKYGTA